MLSREGKNNKSWEEKRFGIPVKLQFTPNDY